MCLLGAFASITAIYLSTDKLKDSRIKKKKEEKKKYRTTGKRKRKLMVLYFNLKLDRNGKPGRVSVLNLGEWKIATLHDWHVFRGQFVDNKPK